MDKNEIFTKTNYWYYVHVVIIITTIIFIPVILFTDKIINFLTK